MGELQEVRLYGGRRGKKWIDGVMRLKVGNKFFAYLSGHGYVGLGEVTAEAVPLNEFKPAGQGKSLPDLVIVAKLEQERNNDPEKRDLCVAVKWIGAVSREDAVLRNRARMGTISCIRQMDLVNDLLNHFDPAKE